MTEEVFTDGQILTAAEMMTLSAQAAGAVQAANNGSDFANPATVLSNIGAGTVNSVALTLPGDLAVSGSPITNAGTLAVTRAAQNANLIQAGPTSGAAAAPAYRALVAADLPPLGDSMIFRTGRFYAANAITDSGTSSAFSTTALTTGVPIFVLNAMTLQTLSCQTSGTVSGTAHVRMALYTDAGGTPGAPVAGADSGDLTQTTAGVLISATLAVPLAPGWYWPAWESSGLAGGTIEGCVLARANAQGGTDTAAGAISANNHALLLTHTYGTALPNPWASTSEGAGTVDIPVIALGF